MYQALVMIFSRLILGMWNWQSSSRDIPLPQREQAHETKPWNWITSGREKWTDVSGHTLKLIWDAKRTPQSSRFTGEKHATQQSLGHVPSVRFPGSATQAIWNAYVYHYSMSQRTIRWLRYPKVHGLSVLFGCLWGKSLPYQTLLFYISWHRVPCNYGCVADLNYLCKY